MMIPAADTRLYGSPVLTTSTITKITTNRNRMITATLQTRNKSVRSRNNITATVQTRNQDCHPAHKPRLSPTIKKPRLSPYTQTKTVTYKQETKTIALQTRNQDYHPWNKKPRLSPTNKKPNGEKQEQHPIGGWCEVHRYKMTKNYFWRLHSTQVFVSETTAVGRSVKV